MSLLEREPTVFPPRAAPQPAPGASSEPEPLSDPLTNHEYDGIREFDNPTPGWWHALFFASIVFSFFYFIYYTFSPIAPTIQDDWQAIQVAEFKRVFGRLGELRPDEPTMHKLMSDGQMMAVWQGYFITNCAACHAKDGGGINGVNLTDEVYKNATSMTDLYRVISNGANNGAMPAWNNRLGENERILLAAYVASLRGTTPASPKGPEGVTIPPWPSPAK